MYFTIKDLTLEGLKLLGSNAIMFYLSNLSNNGDLKTQVDIIRWSNFVDSELRYISQIATV